MIEDDLSNLLSIAKHTSISQRSLDRDYFYFAAGLFTNEQLVGNMFLAQQIAKSSGGKLLADLPQAKESETSVSDRHPHNIRALDLKGVLMADACLFMFENTILDEGMLIELGFAKALGIPSVVVRTDFRKAGDQQTLTDNWNLMCSDWPLHQVVTSTSIADFNRSTKIEQPTLLSITSELYSPLAKQVVKAFQSLREKTAILSGTRAFLEKYFKQVITCYDGSGRLTAILDEEQISAIIERKLAKQLLTLNLS